LSIVFIIATFGEIPIDIDSLLHDQHVQEALLKIEREVEKGKWKLVEEMKEIDSIRELEKTGLIYRGSLNFPLVLKESFKEMKLEINSISEEMADLVYHGLSGLSRNSKEILSIAALGELDVALDDIILAKINALTLDSGEIIVCGFEGAESIAYRSWFAETSDGLLCTIEVGQPKLEIKTSIDANSPIFAGSEEMLDLAANLFEWCLPESDSWANNLDFSGLKRDMFLYGFTKLVFGRALYLLGKEKKLFWDVALKYTIKGL